MFYDGKAGSKLFQVAIAPLSSLCLSVSSLLISWHSIWALCQGWREGVKVLTFLHFFISFTYCLFQLFDSHLAGHYFPPLKKYAINIKNGFLNKYNYLPGITTYFQVCLRKHNQEKTNIFITALVTVVHYKKEKNIIQYRTC